MMLLAANSERQLGHDKAAEALYAQIVQKYPDREEAKDAHYQRLINIYNANDRAAAEVDKFIATNPTGERADQAQLLKAEALYKGNSPRPRRSTKRCARRSSRRKVARGSGLQTRLVLCADENVAASSTLSLIS